MRRRGLRREHRSHDGRRPLADGSDQGGASTLHRHAAKPNPDFLRDVIKGLGISTDKLRLVLADMKAASLVSGKSAHVVIAVADGELTGVMSDAPGLRATLFDFDKRIQALADGEMAGAPSTAKAAKQVDKDFAEATAGMADVPVTSK